MPPGKVLMPLAFGSILGGTTTLIGTPPNLIVSGFRVEAGLGGFGMFDFTPVGLALTLLGLAFIGLVGWRLVPSRQQIGAGGFDTAAYLTEARVTEDSQAGGMKLREIEAALEEAGAQIVGLVRNDVRVSAPNTGLRVQAGNILIIQAEAETLVNTLSSLGLVLDETQHKAEKNTAEDEAESKDEIEADLAADAMPPETEAKTVPQDEIALGELAILPASGLVGRTPSDIRLRNRYGLNLLAVSRQGRRTVARLRAYPLQAGDVLLMQGAPEAIAEFASAAGCVPLAERALYIPDRRKAITASAIMAPAAVRAILDELPGLKRQGKEEQGRFKISYYIDPQVAPSLEEINRLLHQGDQTVNVTLSFGQFLDVLPIRASKGFAVRWFADQWGVPLEHILAAGGSGSDEDMMRGNTLAVVVANRHNDELRRLAEVERIYFAQADYARGILEAIEYYDFYRTCQVPQREMC